MREKNVPLDTLEVKGKRPDSIELPTNTNILPVDTIQSFAVESVGHKLVIITGEGVRTNVTFYKMGQGQKSGKVETLSAYARRTSPSCGTHFTVLVPQRSWLKL